MTKETNDNKPNVERIVYFEKQDKIYPQRVKGKFRRLKWYVMSLLLGIYYLVPFLRWERAGNIPDQAVLIDLPNRRAYFFFIEIWPQEVYYLVGILVFAALLLFAVTSLFGRVWCGYACPQTVWTDLFVWVERIVQGDRNTRMKLDKSKLSLRKIWKKSLTHFLWLVIGLFTGGAWVLYFNDAPTLINNLMHGEISANVLGWIIALTISTYIMAGFAREQVCIYMCPYARFQSAMFDENTLIIGYDEQRGEPRGKHKKGASWKGLGDCVDCKQCVNVCPMGIDIRDGLQMECIACGLCIDACDNIMEKVGLPKKLIRYDSYKHITAGTTDGLKKLLLRPRIFWYSGVFLIIFTLVGFSLSNRAMSAIHVIHDRNPLFVMTSDGSIRNGYNIKISNKSHEIKNFSLDINGIDVKNVKFQGYEKLTLDNIPVSPDSVKNIKIFVSANRQKERRKVIYFKITDNKTNYSSSYETIFVSGKK